MSRKLVKKRLQSIKHHVNVVGTYLAELLEMFQQRPLRYSKYVEAIESALRLLSMVDDLVEAIDKEV